MSDSLLARIAAVQAKHLLVRYDRRAWWCQCGDDCLSVEGSHSFHVADAVIEALPDYLWRCPKCGKGYWADHGPICNVTPPPWGTGQ